MSKKKVYKIRMNCSSFKDFVIKAPDEESAISRAYVLFNCPSEGCDFGELLPVEKDDEIDDEI